MKSYVRAVGLLTAALLFGCTSDGQYQPPAGQKVRISQRTFDYFKEYQATIGSTHPGAFAVSESGRNSYYFYCGDIACVSGPSYGQQAIRGCAAWGEKCYVFAHNNSIEFDYEIY
jgi:hypothetical protein